MKYQKKKEYINKLHKNLGKYYENLLFAYLFLFFIIFLIPTGVAVNSQILINFTNFMKSTFPSIEIISSVSPLSEVTLLYLSIMWLFTSLLFVISIIYSLVICLFFCYYNDDFIAKKNGEKKFSFFISLFGIGLGFYMFDIGWNADWAINGIEMRNNKIYLPDFNTKFEIYILTLVSHFAFVLSVSSVISCLHEILCKIYYGFKRN